MSYNALLQHFMLETCHILDTWLLRIVYGCNPLPILWLHAINAFPYSMRNESKMQGYCNPFNIILSRWFHEREEIVKPFAPGTASFLFSVLGITELFTVPYWVWLDSKYGLQTLSSSLCKQSCSTSISVEANLGGHLTCRSVDYIVQALPCLVAAVYT